MNCLSILKDNRGWDLEARRKDNEILLLEVKGHVGSTVQFELTPNEYEQLKRNADKYRVCVVFEALKNPDLYVFEVKYDENGLYLYSNKKNRIVRFVEKVAAKGVEIKMR